jgi:hypothetical protein
MNADAGPFARVFIPPHVAPAANTKTNVAGVQLIATGDRNGIVVRTPGTIEFAMDGNRNNILDEPGDGHGVACAMGKDDLLAYLDWAGLRPMTELEYEKACRGPLQPLAGEFPWGATRQIGANQVLNTATLITTAAQVIALIVDRGLPTEVINWPAGVNHNNNLPPVTAGLPTGAQCALQVEIVTRNGAFATANSDRIKAGATYWGVMEMGSNLAEPVININTDQGRGFRGQHGDGRLNVDGGHNVDGWPIDDMSGLGHRGGNVANGWPGGGLQTTSQRDIAENTYGHMYFTGGRGVRTAVNTITGNVFHGQ